MVLTVEVAIFSLSGIGIMSLQVLNACDSTATTNPETNSCQEALVPVTTSLKSATDWNMDATR